MSKHLKLIHKILSGRQDQAIHFTELFTLLNILGFSTRISGSHHIFYREDIPEIINIQPVNEKAKPYQVKQIRDLMVKYKLGGDHE
jgi:hypothetical protein